MENVGFQETAGTIICGPVTPEFYTEVLPGLQQFDFSISVPYLEMNDSSLVNIYAALYNGAQLIAYDCIQDSAINLVQQEVNLHIPYPEDGSDWIWKVFVLDAHMKPLVPSDSGNIRKIES